MIIKWSRIVAGVAILVTAGTAAADSKSNAYGKGDERPAKAAAKAAVKRTGTSLLELLVTPSTADAPTVRPENKK